MIDLSVASHTHVPTGLTPGLAVRDRASVLAPVDVPSHGDVVQTGAVSSPLQRELALSLQDEDYAVRAAEKITDPAFRSALARRSGSNRVHFAIALVNDDPEVARAILASTKSPKVAALVDTLAKHNNVEQQIVADELATQADRHVRKAEMAERTMSRDPVQARLNARSARNNIRTSDALLRRSEAAEDKAFDYADVSNDAQNYITRFNARLPFNEHFYEDVWPNLLKIPE